VSDPLPFRLPPVDPAAVHVPGSSLPAELLAGLLADGDDELAAWTLRHAFADIGRAAVFDGMLRDAMRLVGERWRSGQWSIAEEHLASGTLLRALERVPRPRGRGGGAGPLAVLAGVAGERHVIGLVCLEQVLADDGWTVVNLGADLPAADLGAYVARNEVELVALSAMGTDLVGALADSVRAVRAVGADLVDPSRPRIPVLVGGQIAGIPGLAATVEADGVAHSIEEARALAATHRPAAHEG
jgi:methanogenic corrinoid protein MtbC1